MSEQSSATRPASGSDVLSSVTGLCAHTHCLTVLRAVLNVLKAR